MPTIGVFDGEYFTTRDAPKVAVVVFCTVSKTYVLREDAVEFFNEGGECLLLGHDVCYVFGTGCCAVVWKM